MVFNSVKYAVFLPVVLLAYFVIPLSGKRDNVNRYRNLFLLAASYFFYMCWVPQYALLIGFSTVTTYCTALILDRIAAPGGRKACLAANIVLNFGILFVFKYYNFFSSAVTRALLPFGVQVSFPSSSLLLPVGISFYTFQSIGYTVDVYRRDIPFERDFIRYALFVSFFPQLVAGPIERAGNLLPQFREEHRFSYENAVQGLRRILWGMFKKVVIADTAAIFVNAVYNDLSAYSGIMLAAATVLFSIQIYCDFSGYSDIALGSGLMLGFRLMENFKAPYFSRSVAEFWRRWHISLNNWFHDYVYRPLGGGGRSLPRKCFNLLVVFGLSGLWHGANWTYVLWGLSNGVFRVAQELIRKAFGSRSAGAESKSALKTAAKVGFTYLLICLTWIFFRANSVSDARYVFANLLHGWSFSALRGGLSSIISANVLDLRNVRYFIAGMLSLSIAALTAYDYFCIDRKLASRSEMTAPLSIRPAALRWPVYTVVTMLVLWMFVMQNGIFGQTGSFIYFQF